MSTDVTDESLCAAHAPIGAVTVSASAVRMAIVEERNLDAIIAQTPF
jgi:hypothetical protein